MLHYNNFHIHGILVQLVPFPQSSPPPHYIPITKIQSSFHPDRLFSYTLVSGRSPLPSRHTYRSLTATGLHGSPHSTSPCPSSPVTPISPFRSPTLPFTSDPQIENVPHPPIGRIPKSKNKDHSRLSGLVRTVSTDTHRPTTLPLRGLGRIPWVRGRTRHSRIGSGSTRPYPPRWYTSPFRRGDVFPYS